VHAPVRGLIFWARFAAARGDHRVLDVPLVVGGFSLVTGLVSFAYQPNPFWLLFSVEGRLLAASAVGLKRAALGARRSPGRAEETRGG
jgi:hypothetical protein